MTTFNKKRFLELVDGDSPVRKEATERVKNREKYKLAGKIAFKILERLDELGWEKQDFANRMGVSAQQVSKWVSGKHEIKSTTLAKFEDVLGIPFLADYYERKFDQLIKSFESQVVEDIHFSWSNIVKEVLVFEENTKTVSQKSSGRYMEVSVVKESNCDFALAS